MLWFSHSSVGTSRSASGDGSQGEVLTLVPSEGVSGEVSYVLIVEPDGDGQGNPKEEKDTDLGVYDFDEDVQEDMDGAQVLKQ